MLLETFCVPPALQRAVAHALTHYAEDYLADTRADYAARRRLLVNSGAVVLMVILAAAGFGVWSLILPVPLRSAANSLVNRQLHAWRPSRGDGGGARGHRSTSRRRRPLHQSAAKTSSSRA